MLLRLPGADVEVVVHRADATDADLARAAGLPRPSPPRPLADAGLRRGDRLDDRLAGAAAGRARGDGEVVVAVVGGLDSGRRVGLTPGSIAEVGRDPGCDVRLDDPTVSRRHARLTVDAKGVVHLHDDRSRNGTWSDDGELLERAVVTGAPPLRLGAASLVVAGPAPGDLPVGGIGRPTDATGTVPHNRPPRPALPPPPEPVVVPSPPEPAGSRVPLGVVAVVGPLLLAAVMVWLLGNPAFALFALLSPVLAVGNHLEGRRRDRRASRRDAGRWAEAREAFAVDLAVAAAAELERRLASAPDPAEVVRRATQPSMWLWDRRPQHEDWLRLRVGTGDVPWEPPLTGERHGPRHGEVAAAVLEAAVLPSAPVTVDLAGGGVVGVIGPRPAALAVARSLVVQAAVHHGPSDLAVLVAADGERATDWDWTKWLPHVEDPGGGPRRLAAGRTTADALATTWPPAGPTVLVLVDGDELLAGRRSPLRRLLAGRAAPVAGIVVSGAGDRLPSACTAVVEVDEAGTAELRLPALGKAFGAVQVTGMAVDTAAAAAVALARFDDPEHDGSAAALAPVVALLDVLELAPTAASVAGRWAAGGCDPAPRTPLGVDADGAVVVDLATDGPHVLVAGTTGAGKSELLRSLVAGLAAGSSPEHLTFVLVDFKGGSAFDACARLPHTVGLVTDLDASLAERALRCLEAELRHRERVLRSAGAGDLTAYRATGAGTPLPRLVVVVDEFATLKAELPDFVDALVGVAQRGRSLGVHLVLATQRPAGSVSEHVKANANLRIALRVQDPSDSTDVIDGPEAAALPRSRPGRACVRFGPGEVLTLQTALASVISSAERPPVELLPFTFGPGGQPPAAPSTDGGGPTDLERLVDACVAAFARSGAAPPRRPWPDPLPERLDLADPRLDQADDDALAVVGLTDDPDRQCQEPAGWRPAEGNLVVHGVAGSGTTTTLLALAHARVRAVDPARLQVFAVDRTGELAVLGELPHTGAIVGATERERQQRLVRHLRAELDRRTSMPPDRRRALPDIDLLVDGIGSFLADFDDVAGMEVAEAFARIFTDGPEVGIRTVVTAERAGALPAALTATVRQRWMHRIADALDAGAIGAGRGAGAGARGATLPTGRHLDLATGLEAQVAVPGAGWRDAFAAVGATTAAATPVAAPAIRVLPAEVELHELPVGSVGAVRPWSIPIGVADHDLGPAELVVHDGDHVLVAGPARSGRTTALAAIAASVRRAAPAATVVALTGRRSWLASVEGVTALSDLRAAVDATSVPGPGILLVDDADTFDDPEGSLDRLVAAGTGPVVVAAGRSDVLRGLYSHWTRTVRRSRLGVLLRPNLDLDGELLGAALPRRTSAPWVDGRGFLVVDGAASLVQVARVPG